MEISPDSVSQSETVPYFYSTKYPIETYSLGMIDDVFEFGIELLLDLLPNIVWKILLVVVGIVITAFGVTMIGKSTPLGGVLIVVGIFVTGGSLVSLYRSRARS